MQAGALDKRVTILQRRLVASTVGLEEAPPSPIATVAAKVVQGAGKEFLEGGEWQAESRAVITIRYRDDVDETTKVDWAGKRWAVASARIIGRNEALELLCTNRGEVPA